MEIALAVVLFFVALYFVVKGGDIFVGASVSISKRLKMSKVVVGATIVSLATTLPELVIAVFSGADGTVGLALGNSIGSVVFNTCLILGIAFSLRTITFKKGSAKLWIYLIATVIVCVFCFFGTIEIWQAFVLVFLGIGFMVYNFIFAKKDPPKDEEVEDTPLQPIWVSIVMFVMGAVFIGCGSYILVEKAEFLARAVGISEQFIGLTILAMGTSVPELITTISCIRQKAPALAVGNILGSNILNITLILGVTRLSSWGYLMQVSQENMFVFVPLILLLALVLTIPILLHKKTFKLQGITFLVIFALYVAYLIVSLIVPIWGV